MVQPFLENIVRLFIHDMEVSQGYTINTFIDMVSGSHGLGKATSIL